MYKPVGPLNPFSNGHLLAPAVVSFFVLLSTCAESTICPYEIDAERNPGWYDHLRQKCVTAFGSRESQRNGSAIHNWWNECRTLLNGSLITLGLSHASSTYELADTIQNVLNRALGVSKQNLSFLAAYRIDGALLESNIGTDPVSVEVKLTHFTRHPTKEQAKYLSVGRSAWLRVNGSYRYNYSTIRMDALRTHMAVDQWTIYSKGLCALYRLKDHLVKQVQYKECDDKTLWGAVALCESDRATKCAGPEKELQDHRRSFPSAQCSSCHAGGKGPFCLVVDAINKSAELSARTGENERVECGSGTCKNGELCEKKPDGDKWTCKRLRRKSDNFPKQKRGFGRKLLPEVCIAGQLSDDRTRCVCLPNVTGLRCDKPFGDFCSGNPCKQGWCKSAVVIDVGLVTSCKCFKGFTGKYCDKDMDECTENLFSCPLNSKCVNTIGSYKCLCHEGRTGRKCDKVVANPERGKDEGKKYKLFIISVVGIVLGTVMVLAASYMLCLRRRMQKRMRESVTMTGTMSRSGSGKTKSHAKSFDEHRSLLK
uniref:EGF-like domain-containing protein n=1 Tax=Trichuris muris TaxID=70415 RepID=A0A5S6Q5Q6_TRIMR